MTNYLMVYFNLDEDGVYPGLEEYRESDSDVRVKKESGNYCELAINGTLFRTNELELEFSLGGWTASALFNLSVTSEILGELREAIAGGRAKLRLGKYEFFSDEYFNEHLFQ